MSVYMIGSLSRCDEPGAAGGVAGQADAGGVSGGIDRSTGRGGVRYLGGAMSRR